MEAALYDPERGFYPNREKTADFYTAPELHPAFGATLADALAALLRRVREDRPGEPAALVEAGCGDGTLAAQVVSRLRAAHPDAVRGLRVILVERTARDRGEAARRVAPLGLPVEACAGVEALPEFCGVLYSNELVDALPAHLLAKSDGRVREVLVDGTREVLAEPSSAELAAAADAARDLPEGGRRAVCLEAPRWLAAAAARLSDGFLVTIDYGKRYAPDAPIEPRGYRAHRAAADLLASPGTQDLTVPADFEALIAAGADCGLALESYGTLARFLIDAGIERWFAAEVGETVASHKNRAQLKTLLHPEGMGEAFKVLVQRKTISR
ncbi:MAG: SAM-dependent methyltransferase [Elusimicrobia bacterium]|nr:SAM-dependent methyltransferase [Elusimicrobiota bacterium]